MESIPSIEQINVDWLSSHFESSLESKIETQRVGNGQVALCVRFSLSSNEGAFSFVAKAPSQDETSRATAKMQQLYLRETSFYKYLVFLRRTWRRRQFLNSSGGHGASKCC
jgi:hypothetical protein